MPKLHIHKSINILGYYTGPTVLGFICLQCFDTVGWASERASGP